MFGFSKCLEMFDNTGRVSDLLETRVIAAVAGHTEHGDPYAFSGVFRPYLVLHYLANARKLDPELNANAARRTNPEGPMRFVNLRVVSGVALTDEGKAALEEVRAVVGPWDEFELTREHQVSRLNARIRDLERENADLRRRRALIIADKAYKAEAPTTTTARSPPASPRSPA